MKNISMGDFDLWLFWNLEFQIFNVLIVSCLSTDMAFKSIWPCYDLKVTSLNGFAYLQKENAYKLEINVKQFENL